MKLLDESIIGFTEKKKQSRRVERISAIATCKTIDYVRYTTTTVNSNLLTRKYNV